jgi:hypothetical protein
MSPRSKGRIILDGIVRIGKKFRSTTNLPETSKVTVLAGRRPRKVPIDEIIWDGEENELVIYLK